MQKDTLKAQVDTEESATNNLNIYCANKTAANTDRKE